MSGDQLPDAERAVVPERKIVDYLLSPSHPDGRTPTVRVVWFVDNGDGVPRLVTAYPGKRR